MAVDKDALLASRLPEEDVEVAGVGSVRVRSLSRSEVLSIKDKELPVVEMERRLLSMAMVDPKLTEDEISQWQSASAAGEIEPVTSAIMRLSGLTEAAAKEAVKRFRE